MIGADGETNLSLYELRNIATTYGKLVRVHNEFTMIGHSALESEFQRFSTMLCLTQCYAIRVNTDFIKNYGTNHNLAQFNEENDQIFSLFPSFGYNIKRNFLNMIYTIPVIWPHNA